MRKIQQNSYLEQDQRESNRRMELHYERWCGMRSDLISREVLLSEYDNNFVRYKDFRDFLENVPDVEIRDSLFVNGYAQGYEDAKAKFECRMKIKDLISMLLEFDMNEKATIHTTDEYKENNIIISITDMRGKE